MKPKVLFIFTSSRDEIINRIRMKKDADTALHGMNYIDGAHHLVIYPKSIKSLLFIPRLLRYDFVIAQDNLLLGYIISIFSNIFRTRTRWIYIAINSSTLIHRHKDHSIRLFLFRIFWKSYTNIVCISYRQYNDFIALGIPKKHLTFIPFGVDVNFFQEDRDKYSEEDLILSVGRDIGRDYSTLLEAAKSLNYQIIIVASEKNIPKNIYIPNNVKILYNISLIEVRDLYRKAKIIIIVSKDDDFKEGSDCSGQTVILDALASRKAVIATSKIWINDYFITDKDLYVIEPNNSNTIVQAVNSLWHDVNKRNSLADSGYRKVKDYYNTKTFANTLNKLMNSLL